MRALPDQYYLDDEARALRAWAAGMDTAYIAGFLRLPEAQVDALLRGARQRRREEERDRVRRRDALLAAWSNYDADKAQVAGRFGYASSGGASQAVRRARKLTRP